MARTEGELPNGCRVLHLEEIDSTNAEALRLAAAGEKGPLWVVARRQAQGRGRQGRQWISDPGNLYASLLREIDVPPRASAGLSLVAPLAVRASLAKWLPSARIELKWPNDVLLEDKKVAGILLESILTKDAMTVVIGCGVNVRQAPPSTRYGATSLLSHGIDASATEVLDQLAFELDSMLAVWRLGSGFEDIRRMWLECGKGIGQRVSITAGGSKVTGRFEGLAANGALVLRLDTGGTTEVHAGDVEFTTILSAKEA